MAVKIKKVLVSQPAPISGKSPYHDIANKHGFELVFRPFIKVESVTAREFRNQKVNILEHTAIIFTARTAIDHFFALCEELRVAIPESMKYFCVSEQVAVYLQKYIVYRKRKVFYPNENGPLEDLVRIIAKHNKEIYFLPLAEEHKDDLIQLLTQKKINFQRAIMYRTVSNDFTPEETFDYDLLIFFSPAGINSLLKNFPNIDQDKHYFAAFGPSTAQAVLNAGLRLDISAPSEEFPSMAMALDNFMSKK